MARKIALKILMEYETKNGFLNLLLKEYLKPDLDARDRGLITEIVYGVVRNRRYLDFRISSFSNTKLKKLSVPLISILRMGFYQFDFMDKVPEFAVINECVKLAEKFCFKSKGIVNGVLRNAINAPKPDNLPLAVKYSFSDEIFNLISEQYGDKIEAILDTLNKKRATVIRPNTLKITLDELFSLHFPDALKKSDCLIPDSLNLSEKNELFSDGYFSVQSISSQAAVKVLDPQENEKILDACSAPGGKTVYIAEKMKNTGEITALEFHRHRCELVKKNLSRCGIENAEVINDDAITVSFKQKFDRILIDAPCSGLGTIGGKPDIKWQSFDFDGLVSVQYKILENVSKSLKTGGILIYSTCTINKNENICQIEKFLSEHKNFALEPFQIDIEGEIYGKNGYAEILPTESNVGFFIARLKSW